jgi:glycosyltransferase 2 family protein
VTPLRWVLTALSFAALFGVSAYLVSGWRTEGVDLRLPAIAHFLAAGAVVTEILTRAWKITWSARAVGIQLPLVTAIRTCLGGDFGAAITPARSGAEPARFLILSEARLGPAAVLVILFAELFLEALSLAVVVALAAIIFHSAGPVLGALVGVVGGYSAFVLGLGALAFLLSRRGSKGPPPSWAQAIGLHAGRWRVVQRWMRRVRSSVDSVRDLHPGWGALSLGASVVHVAVRLMILPALVLTSAPDVDVAPLALWSLSILYGAVVIPAPGGGGAVEVVFHAVFRNIIPEELFGAALVWWRFYTFYAYIILGALVAGGVVMRALRKEREMEEELGIG